MLRLYALSVLVVVTCSACGGGGSSDGGSETTTAQVSDHSLLTVSGSFPELSEPPANNQLMTSCLTASAAPVGTITGTVQYERVPIHSDGLDYFDIRTLPARGVVVQAVDAPSGSCTSTVVATSLTNGNGEYGLSVADDRPVCIEVRAQLYREGSAGAAGWDVQLVDNTNDQAPYYLVDNAPASPAANPQRHLLAASGATRGFSTYHGPRAAAPFAILDSICEAIDTVLSTDATLQLPLLKINWSEHNTPADGAVEEGDVGGAFYQEIRYLDGQGNITAYDRNIFLLGDEDSNTDEYDPHVINHEFTHYLTAVLSRFDAPGGDHFSGDRLDPRLALEEGMADAFAAITLDGDNPVIDDGRVYKDSLGLNQDFTFRFPIDRNFTGSYGWYSESTVYSSIYNAYDSNNSGDDVLTLGVTPILSVLRSNSYKQSDALITLFTYFNHLKQQTGQDYAIDLLLAAESIDAVGDDFGSGESSGDNDVAGRPDVDPVYLQLEKDVSLQVCSNDQFGVGNKLSNSRFIRFDPLRDGQYELTVFPENRGRPVVQVYKQGNEIAAAQSSARGAPVSLDVNVAGEVVIVVADYDNVRTDGAAPGRYCFDVKAIR